MGTCTFQSSTQEAEDGRSEFKASQVYTSSQPRLHSETLPPEYSVYSGVYGDS